MKAVFKYSLVIVLLTSIAIVVDGSHFLGGTITWSLLNKTTVGTPVNIVITQTYSWTWQFARCTASDIANGLAITFSSNFKGITDKLNCTVNCLAGAVGYVAPPILPYCTDASSVQGSTVGQRSDTVQLKQGDDFTVAFANNAWRPLATAAAAAWSIASRINVTPRLDNGLYDSAPVATMMSPINILVGITQVIKIPIGDADGDIIRCRWSNGSNECADVCPPGSLPNNTSIYSNCTIVITGTRVGDWFAVALMVEDFISESSITPLSSIPVQFLVQVIAIPSCNSRPYIAGLLLEQSCTPVQVGRTFTSQLIAINNCGSNVSISDIATLSFSGMVQINITKQSSTTYYKNLTWTPTTAQLGFQVMCAMAVDSQSSQSPQYCFTFYVSRTSVCACPGQVCATTITTTLTSILSTTMSNTNSPTTITSTLLSTTLSVTAPITTRSSSSTSNAIRSTTSTSITPTTTITSTPINICIPACDGLQIKVSLYLIAWCSMIISMHIISYLL